jgi:hypothetical protein
MINKLKNINNENNIIIDKYRLNNINYIIDYQYWINKEKYLRDDCNINYTDELTKNNNLFSDSLEKIKTFNSSIN